MTPNQAKAILWLPVDGSWTIEKPGRLIAALTSASLAGLAEGEWGEFGPRSGRQMRWRLTEVGVEARRALESDQ